jgi:copper chaperone CopZ
VTTPDTRQVELHVQGMTCAACATRIERRLSRLDQVSARVNFATERARVTAPGTMPVEDLIGAIEAAGYSDEPARPQAADRGQVGYLQRRLILALIFFVPLSDASIMLSLFPAYRFPGWQWLLVARPVHGHAGVAGHHRGLRLVGVRDVLPGPGHPGQPAAAARVGRRDLSRGRGGGDHVPAGRAVPRGQGAAQRGRGHAGTGGSRCASSRPGCRAG